METITPTPADISPEIPLTRPNERVAACKQTSPHPSKSYDKVELFQIDLDQRHDGEIWLRKNNAPVSIPKGDR
jgi:hypothetical protein